MTITQMLLGGGAAPPLEDVGSVLDRHNPVSVFQVVTSAPLQSIFSGAALASSGGGLDMPSLQVGDLVVVAGLTYGNYITSVTGWNNGDLFTQHAGAIAKASLWSRSVTSGNIGNLADGLRVNRNIQKYADRTYLLVLRRPGGPAPAIVAFNNVDSATSTIGEVGGARTFQRPGLGFHLFRTIEGSWVFEGQGPSPTMPAGWATLAEQQPISPHISQVNNRYWAGIFARDYPAGFVGSQSSTGFGPYNCHRLWFQIE